MTAVVDRRNYCRPQDRRSSQGIAILFCPSYLCLGDQFLLVKEISGT